MTINPFILHGEEITPVRKLLYLKAFAGGGALSEYEITGNPVAFNTSVAKPLSGFTIPFFPVQQGTGDPSPENVRPISGWRGFTAYRSGVNMFDADSLVEVDINGGSRNAFAYKTPGKYKLKTFATGSSAYLSGIVKNADSTWSSVYYVVGDTYAQNQTITLTEGQTLYVYDMQGAPKETSVARFKAWEFMVVMGDDFPSAYAEYTGASYPVVFPAVGKNLAVGMKYDFVPQGSNGQPSPTYKGQVSDYIPIDNAKDYVFKSFASNITSYVMFYGEDFAYIGYLNTTGQTPIVLSNYANYSLVKYVIIRCDTGELDAQPMLEEGTTPSATYEPCLGNTIYGGTLDAVNGVLTVEWGILDVKWSAFSIRTDLGDNIRGAMYITQNLSTPGGRGGFCNIATHSWNYSMDRVHFYTDSNLAFIFVPEGTSEDTNIQIVYPLATPYEIQLDPITVQTLIGDNTIWTDTNGENTVKYLKKG